MYKLLTALLISVFSFGVANAQTSGFKIDVKESNINDSSPSTQEDKNGTRVYRTKEIIEYNYKEVELKKIET